jgi:hypothetical protein
MNATLFTKPSSTFFSRFMDFHFGPDEERGEDEKRRGFREHNENVEKGRELLVFEVREGWEPLCRFLGREVPGEEFPRSDDWATMGWKKVSAVEPTTAERTGPEAK